MVKLAGQPKSDTKGRILGAADHIVVRRGVDAARMQEIADHEGVNRMVGIDLSLAKVGRVVPAVAVLALVLTVPDIYADSATAVITVSATVSQNCAISTTPLAYGAYDPIGANASNPLDGTGSVVLRCTRGTTASIALDSGANASGTARRMTNAAAAFLGYELYKDSAHANVWTDTADGMLSAGSAPSTDPRSFTVYGRVAGAQDVPVGTFTDSVVATVNF